jgi:hypothetical protein
MIYTSFTIYLLDKRVCSRHVEHSQNFVSEVYPMDSATIDFTLLPLVVVLLVVHLFTVSRCHVHVITTFAQEVGVHALWLFPLNTVTDDLKNGGRSSHEFFVWSATISVRLQTGENPSVLD